MLTLVLAEEVQEVEIESEISQIEIRQWHYSVPCAGVRYYIYQQEPPPAEQPDLWAPDVVPTRM